MVVKDYPGLRIKNPQSNTTNTQILSICLERYTDIKMRLDDILSLQNGNDRFPQIPFYSIYYGHLIYCGRKLLDYTSMEPRMLLNQIPFRLKLRGV
jgi:hypothetical protein